MRSFPYLGRLLALVSFAFALGLAAVPPAHSQTVWSSDQDISDGDVNETYTSLNNQRFISEDDSNNLYIAFFDNRYKTSTDNNFEIFFRRFIFNFGSPYITRVTNAPNMSKYPSMTILNWGVGDSATVNDSGRVYLTWQDARDYSIPAAGEPIAYSIYFRTFQSQGGDAFGPEIRVSPIDSVNTATDPVIAIDTFHNAWIVWQTLIGLTGTTDFYYAVYNGATRTMGPQTVLVNNPASSRDPSLTADRFGNVYLAWTDNRSGANEIWWKQYTPGVGWGPDTQIVFSPTAAQTPSITADYDGRLHLVWVDTRGGNNDVFYKMYTPGVGWDAVDTQLTVDPSSQIQPYVDGDPMGNAYVVWTDLRNGSSNPDIYYKDHKGGTWSADFQLVGNNTDNNSNAVQRFPGLTHDGLGTTYVTWEDERLPASIGKNKEVFYKYGQFNVTAAPLAPPVFASRLLKTFPNPFNPEATIRFELARDTQVTLRAYDAQGRVVRTILSGYLAAGPRQVRWDGRDDSGRSLPSGTYFLRLQAGLDSRSSTVTLLK